MSTCMTTLQQHRRRNLMMMDRRIPFLNILILQKKPTEPLLTTTTHPTTGIMAAASNFTSATLLGFVHDFLYRLICKYRIYSYSKITQVSVIIVKQIFCRTAILCKTKLKIKSILLITLFSQFFFSLLYYLFYSIYYYIILIECCEHGRWQSYFKQPNEHSLINVFETKLLLLYIFIMSKLTIIVYFLILILFCNIECIITFLYYIRLNLIEFF